MCVVDLIFWKLFVFIKGFNPSFYIHWRKNSDQRFPFNHRQSAAGEARKAPDNDHQEDQQAEAIQP